MNNKTVSLGDRYAEIAVVAVTVVALLAGWMFKASVENRSVLIEKNGISAQAPKGWLQSTPQGDEILHTTDISTDGFGATYVLRAMPISADVTAAQIASLQILDHSQNFTAFRELDQREVTLYGKSAYEISYVFVESNPDVTFDGLPHVVRGVDYVFIDGETAVIATFWADKENFDLDLSRFLRFVESIAY